MEIYQQRIHNLKELLAENGCDGLIVDDKINLFYLTGLSLSAGRLIVHANGTHLAVDGRYVEMCKIHAPFPVILAENTQSILQVLQSPEIYFRKDLAFSSDHTTYSEFQQLQRDIDSLNAKSQKKVHLKPLDNPTAKLRMIKDKGEIDILREAAKLGSEGFDFVCSLLKEKITEAELAVELDIFWKRRGGKTLAFDPIIAFGSNSSMPHYRVGHTQLRKGQCVLIDIGVNYENYHSDMTRVVYYGEPDPKLLAIHEIVLKAQQQALDLCKPGTLIGDLDAAARSYIADRGYGDHFTHSLGHGVGLEIHEAPWLRSKPPFSELPLQEGMVITIEPGIYLPGIGGVRLEDTVVITEKGLENLTNRNKEPVVLG